MDKSKSNVMIDEDGLHRHSSKFKKIFFYYVCGMGMSFAAGLLVEKGSYHVEGFDLDFAPPLGPILKNRGIKCHRQVDAELLSSFDLIVVGNVIPKSSADAKMIESSGIPFCSFPAMLGALVLRDVNVIGICGTHGKTTTTYFAVQVFQALGEAPGYFVGGVIEEEHSCALGGGKYFFIEGDEYDSAYFHKESKFRSYHLNSMILTSLEFDHADIFTSLNEIQDQFRSIMTTLDNVICCQGFLAIEQLIEELSEEKPRILWYGGEFMKIDSQTERGTSFLLFWQGEYHFFETNIIGKYNIENLSGVILYALREGFSIERIRAAVRTLKQVKRRQEFKGFYRGAVIVDDFAHHPSAVRKVMETIKIRFPGRFINVIFEPASATARSDIFQEEFANSLKGAHRVLLVRPSKLTTVKNHVNIDSERLKNDVLKSGASWTIGDTLDDILLFIEKNAGPKELFLVMSNSSCRGLWESGFASKWQVS